MVFVWNDCEEVKTENTRYWYEKQQTSISLVDLLPRGTTLLILFKGFPAPGEQTTAST